MASACALNGKAGHQPRSRACVQICKADKDRFIWLGVKLSGLTDVRGAGPTAQANIQPIIAVCFNGADDATAKRHAAILTL